MRLKNEWAIIELEMYKRISKIVERRKGGSISNYDSSKLINDTNFEFGRRRKPRFWRSS